MANFAKYKLDKFLSKFISRKLLVWAFSTGFLYSGLLSSDEWVAISLAYIGIEGIADIAIRWRSASNGNSV
tara:strand:+ start:860 stop:1072 length:213 start_codon:yes stop_codon:yes gene_type:complete